MGIIEKMRLDGKKGFVTGAARGIGKCTATAFAEAGADVAIVDLDIEVAEQTAREIAEATGRKVIAIKCDVTKEDDVQKMVDERLRIHPDGGQGPGSGRGRGPGLHVQQGQGQLTFIPFPGFCPGKYDIQKKELRYETDLRGTQGRRSLEKGRRAAAVL